MTTEIELHHPAGAAFDKIAAQYDDIFTASPIGQSQRATVWRHVADAFPSGSRVLELNCGTGEDALFLARRGVSVVACDASEQMIEHARLRKANEAPDASAFFSRLPIEHLRELETQSLFDGVLSNFSGLNCVADLAAVFMELALRTRAGAKLLLCLSTRFCAWEFVYYAAQGDFRKATRRCRGAAVANIDGVSFPIYYPTIRSLCRAFGAAFRLRSITGIGIAVPPSYLNTLMGSNPTILEKLERLDAAVCGLPIFRVIGDHVLLHLERV
jgi:ubiquinone/menaquinone biosynthesis C-methylase UbiE